MSVAYPLRDEAVWEVATRDARYDYAAYEFVLTALRYTQHMLGRDVEELAMADKHVSGRQLLDGVRQMAVEQFGLMALAVFGQWGIRSSADFGEIVFNLVEADLLKKTDEDTREDFRDVFDFEEAFLTSYRIPTDTDIL